MMDTILVVQSPSDAGSADVDGPLRRYGYNPVHATSARQGLQLLRACRPKLLLLDMILPDMTALTFLEILNQRFGHPPVPVILMGEMSRHEMLAEGERLGATDHLLKSHFTAEDLVGRVREHLPA